jgi:hypothetical protein
MAHFFHSYFLPKIYNFILVRSTRESKKSRNSMTFIIQGDGYNEMQDIAKLSTSGSLENDLYR